MKRLLLGLISGAFLLFVGIQAAHAHSETGLDSCRICVMGTQSAAHVAADAPSVVPVLSWVRIAEVPAASAGNSAVADTPARAPPVL